MTERLWSRRQVSVAAGSILASLVGGGCLGTDDLAGEQETMPQARFAFDLRLEGDGNAGTLEITHVGGDAILRDELLVVGDRFTDVRDANVTTPDTLWAGTATKSVPGGQAVSEGDYVVVGVRPDYEVELVWQPAGVESQKTLETHTGPAA